MSRIMTPTAEELQALLDWGKKALIPQKFAFSPPYTIERRPDWVVLRAHNVVIASFCADVWKSEQGCIEAAWYYAYGPKETDTDIIARLEVQIEDLAAAIRTLATRIPPLSDDVAVLVKSARTGHGLSEKQNDDGHIIRDAWVHDMLTNRLPSTLEYQSARIAALEAQIAAADRLASDAAMIWQRLVGEHGFPIARIPTLPDDVTGLVERLRTHALAAKIYLTKPQAAVYEPLLTRTAEMLEAQSTYIDALAAYIATKGETK